MAYRGTTSGTATDKRVNKSKADALLKELQYKRYRKAQAAKRAAAEASAYNRRRKYQNYGQETVKTSDTPRRPKARPDRSRTTSGSKSRKKTR